MCSGRCSGQRSASSFCSRCAARGPISTVDIAIQAARVDQKIKWCEWNASNSTLEKLEQDLAGCQSHIKARQREVTAAQRPLERRQKEVDDLESRHRAAKDALKMQQQSSSASVSALTRKLSDKVRACGVRNSARPRAQVNGLMERMAKLDTLERRDVDHCIAIAEARLEVCRAREQLRTLPPLRPAWREEKRIAEEEHNDVVSKVRLWCTRL